MSLSRRSTKRSAKEIERRTYNSGLLHRCRPPIIPMCRALVRPQWSLQHFRLAHDSHLTVVAISVFCWRAHRRTDRFACGPSTRPRSLILADTPPLLLGKLYKLIFRWCLSRRSISHASGAHTHCLSKSAIERSADAVSPDKDASASRVDALVDDRRPPAR
jgi:hypothetical protein